MRAQDLDSRQKEVVEAVKNSSARRVLVLGGPGSGKTAVALWSARAILDAQPSARVLFLTFSRAAVSQIMNRSPGVLAGVESRVEIQTFHGLSFRVLRAYGRYAGYDADGLSIQAETRRRLFGVDPSILGFGDLIPGFLRLLHDSPRLKTLIASRWRLVVCDEVQDTSAEQFDLLNLLAQEKLLMLGDVNQLIYTFIPGVSVKRFQDIKNSSDKTIELEPRSHRDPTGAIPALAKAVFERRFEDPAVTEALGSGRLVIMTNIDDDSVASTIKGLVETCLLSGQKEIGVFVHSNAAVAEIADRLSAAGVEHALVGIPEAHAEALDAMMQECSFAVGTADWQDVCVSFAIYLTSCVRGRQPPELAQKLLNGGRLPEKIVQALADLRRQLEGRVNVPISDLLPTITESWPRLAITSGIRPWQMAAKHFGRLVYPYRGFLLTESSCELVARTIHQARMEAMLDMSFVETAPVRLMNYHQTKGREADTVIHVFRDDDYFGREVSEPFEELSRLLNVAVSRARQQVVILLPPSPHPVIRPFAGLANQSLKKTS